MNKNEPEGLLIKVSADVESAIKSLDRLEKKLAAIEQRIEKITASGVDIRGKDLLLSINREHRRQRNQG